MAGGVGWTEWIFLFLGSGDFELVVEDLDFVGFEFPECGAEVCDGLVAFLGADGGDNFGTKSFEGRAFGGFPVGDFEDMPAEFGLDEGGAVERECEGYLGEVLGEA